MSQLRRLVYATGFAALVGAATAARAASDLHSLGIISQIGDTATVLDIGYIGPEKHLLSIADWQMDSAVVEKIRSLLPARLQVKEVKYDRGALLALDGASMLNSYHMGLKAFIQSVAAQNTVDGYLVVHKRFDNERLRVRGLGGLHDGASFGISPLERTMCYAFYEIDVFDAHTGRLVDVGTSAIASNDPIFRRAEPMSDLDKKLWPGIFAARTSEEARGLKSCLEPLVSSSMETTLQRLDIVR